MKRIGLIGGGLIAILAIVIVIVPYLIPSEVYKAQVEKQAEAALGREVSLEGDARLSIVPSIAARIGGVKVANPEGFASANMIEAGELRARVKFWPLISGRVEIAEISLVDANVSLERLASGTANWEFGTSSESTEAPTEETASLDAGIDSARLINSSLSYVDAMTGERYELTEFSGRASMKALDKPLSFNGEGKLNGQVFDLSLDLASIDLITSGQSTAVDLSLETDLGNVSYYGEVTLGELPNLSGDFQATSSALSALSDLIGIDPGINLNALGELSAKGTVSGPADALKINFDRVSQSAEQFSATYSGLIDLSSTTPLDGSFTLQTKNAASAFEALDLGLPIQLAPIGSINMEGQVSGSFASPKITFERLKQNSDLMSTDYTGLIAISDDPRMDGTLNTSISDAGRVLTMLGMDTGPIAALEEFEFSGNLNGPLSALKITGANLLHSGDLLNVDFNGDAALGGSGQISGPIKASSQNLRGLFDVLGVELSPGETLQKFDLQGTLSGTPLNLNIAELKLNLDDVTGEGRAGLDMTGAAPKITADMNIPILDLSPFLGESTQSETTTPQTSEWSKTPLALDGLRAVNADVTLKSDQLTLGDIELTNTNLNAKLINGDFNADIDQLSAFGGNWNGTLQLDASRTAPRLSIDLKGANVAMDSVLSTFANLETVSGAGGLEFKATSSGQSLDALVRSLNGKLTTDLSDGTIKGFNVAQIVRSLGSIQGALSNGSLDFGLSPEAETDFTRFDGALTITNGVANVDLMRALNPAVLLDGKGRIDLANQTIDISITPSIDSAGAGDLGMLKLNGEPFALPFRVSGNWLSPSVSIDSAIIGRQLRARATGEIGSRITDEIGGELGGLIGDALGVPKQKAPEETKNSEESPDSQEPSENSEDKKTDEPKDPEPENLEDALENAAEDLANDALKDLFGRKN